MLILGLIMMLLMTVVGLAAIRGSGLQETMAGNVRDRNLAFQAAEAGLRAGEGVINDDIESHSFGSETGFYEDLGRTGSTLSTTGKWGDADWVANSNQVDVSLEHISAENQPRYVIEQLAVPRLKCQKRDGGSIDLGSIQNKGPCIYYRVTSRGVGATGTADALVQSMYRKR